MPAHQSPAKFENIELTQFPKHLPLRPAKQNRIVNAIKKQPIHILVTVLCLLVTLVGFALGAWFVGSLVQKNMFIKHPDAVVTAEMAKSVTTVQVTTTQKHSQLLKIPDLDKQITVVVTETLGFSLGLQKGKASMEATSTVHMKVSVTASPGRQKPKDAKA